MGNKGQTFDVIAPERELVVQLLDVATKPRDRAAIVLLWRGGMRNAEACSLEWPMDFQALEEGGCKVHIRRPKGWSKGVPPRWVGIDPQGVEILDEWITARGRHGGAFLCTSNGRAIHTSQLRRTCKVLARMANAEQRVHPHAFRHAHAQEFVREGFNIRDVQNSLGHSNLGTTEKYLRGLGCDETVAKAARREW